MSVLYLNRPKFFEHFNQLLNLTDLNPLKLKVYRVKEIIEQQVRDSVGILDATSDSELILFDKKLLINELNRIIEARTIERTQYYIRRLTKSLNEVKTTKINDINLMKWKVYDE